MFEARILVGDNGFGPRVPRVECAKVILSYKEGRINSFFCEDSEKQNNNQAF